MSNIKISFFSIALSVLFAVNAIPQTKKTEILKPVEIKAKQKEKTKIKRLKPEITIKRKQIEEDKPFNVLDEIRLLSPSIFVSRRSLMGYGLASGAGGLITIRGIGGRPNTSVLLLEDGVPNRMGLFGHPIQDYYLPEDVQNIEIYKGSSSVGFGNSALGGAINLISRKRTEPGFETEIMSRCGRYGTIETTLSHGGKMGKWDYYIASGYRSTEGHLDNNSFRMKNGSVRIGNEINDNFYVWLKAKAAEYAIEDPFYASSNLFQHVARRGAKVCLEEKKDKATIGRYVFFYDYGDHAFTNGWDSEDFTTGISLYRTFILNEILWLTGGFDWTRWGGKAWSKNRTIYRGKHVLNETSGYLSLTNQLMHNLSVTGSIRVAYTSDFDTTFLPGMNAEYNFFEFGVFWKTKVGWQRGYRLPTINELHYPFPAFNPDLQPEKADTFEVSLSGMKGIISGDITLFAIRGHDAIVRFGPPPPFSIENSGHYRHRGIETSIKIGDEKLGGSIGYAYLHHEGISPGAFRARLISSLYIGSGLVEEFPIKWKFKIFNETVYALWGIPGTKSHKNNFSSYGARLSILPIKYGEIFFGAENLTNNKWYEVGNLKSPGRSYWGGIKITF